MRPVPKETSKRQVLVFAHVPPPHHGQSVMVELMLRGLSHDPDLSVIHVDARLSDDLGDVGGIRAGKLGRLLAYCWSALAARFRHGPMDLYYVPAPAKKSAIIRDWIVMLLLRPLFSKIILHWHATGLAKWACGSSESENLTDSIFPKPLDRPARWLTRILLGRCTLSIILTEAEREEVSLLHPERIAVIPNGIPDPCPHFESEVLPHKGLDPTRGQLRCLYLAHCTKEKGLFDAVEAVCMANETLTQEGSQRRISLTVAGSFMNDAERKQFDSILSGMPGSPISYAGFVSGEHKRSLLRDHDCLISFSRRETFGLNVVEALAFGMLPCLSPIAPYLENFSKVAVIAEDMTVISFAKALRQCALTDTNPQSMRNLFLASFTEEKFVERIRKALKENA